MKKYKYHIYALRIKGEENFFYIGVTKQSPGYRFYMHECTVRTGSDANVAKAKVMSSNEGNVEVVVLKEYFTTRDKAHKQERKTIDKYFKLGHPLTNKKRKDFVPTKSLKIDADIVYRIKYYVAANGGTMTSFVEEALKERINVLENSLKAV